MKEKIKCCICGKELTEETSHVFDGDVYCEDCLEAHTCVCDHCSSRVRRYDVVRDEENVVCTWCYDDYYTRCEGCGRIILNEDAEYFDEDDQYPYCHECAEEFENRPIKDYHYKPNVKFYGEGPLYYGIELEIDKGGEVDENAYEIMQVGNSDEDRIYCKHDGSINNGFEIVSHAATAEYHLTKFPWREILDKARKLGYCSHNTSTCGLHIHASRSALGENYERQEETIGRIVHFVELHWNEILKFTRRTEDNINRWAARYGISTKAKDTYKNAKDRCLGRYVAVNLVNCETIEFRMFRGTLLYSTFAATIQLVDEICSMAVRFTDKEVEDMSWSDFVLKIPTEKKELIDYLKSKRLYVNELNAESEEI